MKQLRKRLTYANVMSSIAVFLVLGGATAIAANQLGKNSVGTKQLKRNAVTTAKIKKNAVTAAKIRNGAITGAKVNLGSLGTVPTAGHANTAGSATQAGNAGTVGGQSVHKIFKTLTAGQSNVLVTSIAGFDFVASCESEDADLVVNAPVGPAFVMQAGGVAGDESNVTTDIYASAAGTGGSMLVDQLSAGTGDSPYGTATFYAATSAGTVLSGNLGYDYDTFDDSPPDTCMFAGHITSG